MTKELIWYLTGNADGVSEADGSVSEADAESEADDGDSEADDGDSENNGGDSETDSGDSETDGLYWVSITETDTRVDADFHTDNKADGEMKITPTR